MFEIHVSKEDFKFHCAHFVAYEGYRERLHGHNYRMGVRLTCLPTTSSMRTATTNGTETTCGIGVPASVQVAGDGYLLDFANVKDACRGICKRLNEHFICPMYSDVLQIEECFIPNINGDDNTDKSADDNHTDKPPRPRLIRISCQDGAVFQFPYNDCVLLPIVHSTVEELCVYLWSELLQALDINYLRQRRIHSMQVTVTEAPGQEATFTAEIPKPEDTPVGGGPFTLDVRSFIASDDIVPRPCQSHDPSGGSSFGLCAECNRKKVIN